MQNRDTRLQRAYKFALLTGAGLLPYMTCYFRHLCTEGHLQHPPYGAWNYLVDTLWVGLFSLAAFAVLRSDVRSRFVCFAIFVFLIFSRFKLQGMDLFEFPALIGLGIASVRAVERHNTANTPPNLPAQPPESND